MSFRNTYHHVMTNIIKMENSSIIPIKFPCNPVEAVQSPIPSTWQPLISFLSLQLYKKCRMNGSIQYVDA